MWLTDGCQEPQLQAGDSALLSQVNSEYYTGWLDYWGEAHASTSSVQVARGLEDMLQLGANVNMQVVSWQGHSLGGRCPPICQHWSGHCCSLLSRRAWAGGGRQGWDCGCSREGQCLLSPRQVCGGADGALWGVP